MYRIGSFATVPYGSTLRTMDTAQSKQTGIKQGIEEHGFSVLRDVFSKPEVEILIESISKIEREALATNSS